MDTKIASQFYNASAEACGPYDPDNDDRPHVIERVRPLLERVIKPGMRVLELGCGSGRYMFAIEAMGAVPTGIDCASIPLAQGRQTAEDRNSRATFVQGDYCKLPFAPASFDAAISMNNIIECSYDDADTIARQLREILAPGGLFCLSMPDYLAQHQESGRDLMCYDSSTGLKESEFEIPDQGSQPCHSYFWTAAFAKFVCSRYLALHEEEKRPGGRHWLVFRNESVVV